MHRFILTFCFCFLFFNTLLAQTRNSFLDLKDVPAGLTNGAYINAADYGVSTGATAAANTSAMQSALNAGNTRGTPVLITTPGFYAFNSALQINPRATSIIAVSGVYLDFSTGTNTNCLEYRAIPRAGTTSFEQKAYENFGWKLRCNATQTGISLLGLTGLADSSCITFNNVTIDGANIAVNVATNAWQITFNDYLISSSTIHVYTGDNSVTNSGEQIIFNNGLHSGTNDLCFKSENYGNQTVFNNCSIDTGLIAHVDTGATVIFKDCWFESQVDLENKISIQGTGGLGGAAVVIKGGYLNVAAGGLKYNSQVNCGNLCDPQLGGFFCDGVRIDSFLASGTYFVNGPGRAKFSNLRTGAYGFNNGIGNLTLASCLNPIYDSSFEGTNYVSSGWSIYTPTTTTLNASFTPTQAYIGSKSLALIASDSQIYGVYQDVDCRPGDIIFGGFWYKSNALGSATATVSTQFRTASDTLLVEDIQTFSGNIASWSWSGFDSAMKHTPAPVGTAKFRVLIFVAASAGGSGVAYFDDLRVNIIH